MRDTDLIWVSTPPPAEFRTRCFGELRRNRLYSSSPTFQMRDRLRFPLCRAARFLARLLSTVRLISKIQAKLTHLNQAIANRADNGHPLRRCPCNTTFGPALTSQESPTWIVG